MKKQKKTIEVTDEKPFIIISAVIKDDFCEYEYEVKTGTGIGDVHKVKGKGIVDTDLTEAFQKLNVHLAHIDDVFKHTNTTVDDINDFHAHALTYLYRVNGFKVKANGDNETIILTGIKIVSTSHEQISITTPRIPLDSLSSYPWWNELKEAADLVRDEVEQYKNGKCTPVEVEQVEDKKQMSIGDVIDLEIGKV